MSTCGLSYGIVLDPAKPLDRRRVTSPCVVSRRYVLSHAPEVSSERCLSPHRALGLDRAGHEHPVPARGNAWSFPATCAPSSAGQFVRRNPAGAYWWHTWTGRSSDRILQDREATAPLHSCFPSSSSNQ